MACGGRGKTRAATFPYHCAASPTPIPSQEQTVFVQYDVGIRMEVLAMDALVIYWQSCGREVIFDGLFPFIDAHCVEKLKCCMRIIGLFERVPKRNGFIWAFPKQILQACVYRYLTAVDK